MDKLTHKQELFSQLVVKLNNQSQAYRDAYDVSENIKSSTVWTKSSELMANGKVSARVEELRKKEREKHNIDRDFIINGYLEIINDTNHVFKLADLKKADSDSTKRFYKLKEITSNADKLRAMENLSKMLGLNEPDKLDISITAFQTKWGE